LTIRTLADATGEPEWSSTILPFMVAADTTEASAQKMTAVREQLAEIFVLPPGVREVYNNRY
jgi:hypothetical protein